MNLQTKMRNQTWTHELGKVGNCIQIKDRWIDKPLYRDIHTQTRKEQCQLPDEKIKNQQTLKRKTC